MKMDWTSLIYALGYIFLALRLGVTRTFTRFEKVDGLDGTVCPESDEVFVINFSGYGNDGASFCAARCSTDAQCETIFYDFTNSKCTGCSSVYDVNSVLDVSAGTMYYVKISKAYQENCSSVYNNCKEPNQECFTDTCICSPGYSYNPSSQTCVDECVTYGTTFQIYQGRRILNHNFRTVSNLTLSECISACLSSELCLSIDYVEKSQQCKLQKVTVKTMTTSYEEMPLYKYLARDCA